MKTPPQQLVSLAETLAAHQGVKHWAISKRYTSKSDFFSRLMKGRDTSSTNYALLMSRFDADWPADLDWPADIPRPSAMKRASA